MTGRAWLSARWERLKWLVRDGRARFGNALTRTGTAAKKAWREIATATLGLGGWSILTDVIARSLGPLVWEVSLGLLCFSLFGWRLAFTVARDGVYALSKRGQKP